MWDDKNLEFITTGKCLCINLLINLNNLQILIIVDVFIAIFISTEEFVCG